MEEHPEIYQQKTQEKKRAAIKNVYSEKEFVEESNKNGLNIVEVSGEFKFYGTPDMKLGIRLIYTAGNEIGLSMIRYKSELDVRYRKTVDFVTKVFLNPRIDDAREAMKKNIKAAKVNALHAIL